MKTREVSAVPNTRRLCVCAMMIAMEVILHRFLAYQGQSVQFNLAFLPISILAMAYGPVWSALAWGVADTLGTLLAGNGSWFPLFSVTAMVSGLLMGLFFYKKEVKLWRVVVYVVVNAALCSLLLQTFFLTVYFKDWAMGAVAGWEAFQTRLGLRLIQNAILVPIQIISIYAVQKALHGRKLLKMIES